LRIADPTLRLFGRTLNTPTAHPNRQPGARPAASDAIAAQRRRLVGFAAVDHTTSRSPLASASNRGWPPSDFGSRRGDRTTCAGSAIPAEGRLHVAVTSRGATCGLAVPVTFNSARTEVMPVRSVLQDGTHPPPFVVEADRGTAHRIPSTAPRGLNR